MNIPLKKIVDDCKACNKPIDVSEVADIYLGSFSTLYNEGGVLKEVEKRIGEDNFNLFVTSMMSTFLVTLYCSANFDNVEDAIRYGASVGAQKAAVFKTNKKFDA